jgi:hypothetical protein
MTMIHLLIRPRCCCCVASGLGYSRGFCWPCDPYTGVQGHVCCCQQHCGLAGSHFFLSGQGMQYARLFTCCWPNAHCLIMLLVLELTCCPRTPLLNPDMPSFFHLLCVTMAVVLKRCSSINFVSGSGCLCRRANCPAPTVLCWHLPCRVLSALGWASGLHAPC